MAFIFTRASATLARAGAAAFLLMVGSISAAHATGSLSCTIVDKAVAFQADAVFSHGLGGSFSNFKAALELNGKGVPPDLARLEMDGAALVHHWFSDGEVRLHLYQERAEGAYGSVELVLKTKLSPKDETLYTGRYTLEVATLPEGASEAVVERFKGKAECEAG